MSLLYGGTLVGGSDVTIIDDFERSSLDHYTGDTGSFSITDPTYTAPNGSNVLRTTTGAQIESQSDDSNPLSNYPQPGQEFRVYMRRSGGTGDDQRFYWAFDDSENDFVWMELDNGAGEFQIWYQESGTNSNPANKTFTASQDTIYEIIVQWDDGSTFGGSDGDHTFEVRNYDTDSQEIAPFDVNNIPDTVVGSPAPEGISFHQFSGSVTMDWDYVHISQGG